jgi:hypothetical protein
VFRREELPGAGGRHAFDHQGYVRRAILGRRHLVGVTQTGNRNVEVEELVRDRNTNLFARVTRQHFRTKAQRIGYALVILHWPHRAVEPEHTQTKYKAPCWWYSRENVT